MLLFVRSRMLTIAKHMKYIMENIEGITNDNRILSIFIIQLIILLQILFLTYKYII
jgi:membrane protein insertase Oxa1/YidC/SpoIIIJ